MSRHEPNYTIDADGASVDRLVDFFLHNGYVREDDTENGAVKLGRGQSGAGWWSSEMTRLQTRLRIRDADDGVCLDYSIETTGQHLTDDDRAFWDREVEAARAFLADGELVDLRPREAERAEELKDEMRQTAKWAMAIVFVIIVASVVIAEYFGYF